MSNVGNTSNFDLAQPALAALSRARLRPAEDALGTNTYMVVEENGKVLHENPQQYLRKRSEQPFPRWTWASSGKPCRTICQRSERQ